MLHKACFAIAVWFIPPAAHAQYAANPTVTVFVNDTNDHSENSSIYSTNNSVYTVPSAIAEVANNCLPSEILQKVEKWHKEGNERESKISGWYSNGQLAIEFHTRKSVLHGMWQTWYQHGQPRDAGSFFRSIPNNEWKSWYGNGKLRSIRQYDAHKLQMVEVAVRQRNPKLAFHTISQEAIKHPEKLKSLLSPGFTLIGSGINSTSYYLPFATCFHNGFFANYFENGIMQQSGFYKDGLKDGLWMQWNADGKMISSGYYFHGTLHGAAKTYNNAGTIQKMTEYKYGKKIFSRNYN